MLYPPCVSEGQEQQSVVIVRETLKRLGARGEVRRLDDSARTAKEAADALGIEVGQIASSLIFLADGEPVLVIASGGHRVDTTMLSAILEGAEITKANADDVRQATGFAIGGVGPLATRSRCAPSSTSPYLATTSCGLPADTRTACSPPATTNCCGSPAARPPTWAPRSAPHLPERSTLARSFPSA